MGPDSPEVQTADADWHADRCPGAALLALQCLGLPDAGEKPAWAQRRGAVVTQWPAAGPGWPQAWLWGCRCLAWPLSSESRHPRLASALVPGSACSVTPRLPGRIWEGSLWSWPSAVSSAAKPQAGFSG